MKNAFGGLLNEQRHWTHPVIHETLVDLLMIQKKIHRGMFAVMDGTFAGDGPGPRCMVPHVKNVHPGERRPGRDRRGRGEAHGLRPDVDASSSASRTIWASGVGDRATSRSSATRRPAPENWHFDGPFKKMTFASRNQHQIYWGPLKKPIEWSLKTVAGAVGVRRERHVPRHASGTRSSHERRCGTSWAAPGAGCSGTGSA